MMTVVKLTSYEGENPVYVNFDTMAYMEGDGMGGTQIIFDGGEVAAVRETPDKIMDTLKHVLKYRLSLEN